MYKPEGGIYSGNLHIALLDENDNPLGFRDVGNTRALACDAPKVDKKTKKGYRNENYGLDIESKIMGQTQQVKFTPDDISRDNLAMALFGEDSVIAAQTGAAVANEGVTVYVGKKSRLAKRRLKTSPAPVVAIPGATFATAGDTDRKLNLSTSGKTKLAVKFTQDGGASIKHIALALKKFGTIEGTKVLTVTLEADNAGDPSGTPLGTAGTVIANSIGLAYEDVVFTFSSAVPVSNGSVYWIVLTSDYTASDSNYISWSTLAAVSGGTLSTYAAATWTGVTTEKPLFTAYELVDSADYEIDYNYGIIEGVSGGAIADDTAALISYSTDDHDAGYQVLANKVTQILVSMLLLGKNTITGDDVEVEVFKASLNPSAIDWITSDFNKIDIVGDILAASKGTWVVRVIPPKTA